MTDTAAQRDDLIRRACSNLQALRNNLPDRFVYQEGMYAMFAQALDELHQAGEDVGEWRLRGRVGEVHAREFGARIDAILMYFTVTQENVQIGFRH